MVLKAFIEFGAATATTCLGGLRGPGQTGNLPAIMCFYKWNDKGDKDNYIDMHLKRYSRP